MKTIFNKQKRSVAGVLIALTALTTALVFGQLYRFERNDL